MMKRNHTRLYAAAAALATTLALGSTPLLAQVAPAPVTPVEAAPVPPFPEAVAPPAEPVIVVPEIEAAPVPNTVTTPEPTTTTRTERATSPAAPPAPAPRIRDASPAEPAPVAVDGETAPVVAEAAPETAAEPIALAATEASAPDDPSSDALLFGLAVIAAIAAIVLAIWGFVAIGRRKPVDRKAAEIIERPAVKAPQPAPIAPEVPIVAEAAPVTPTPIRAPAPGLAHTGAAVALPRTMPDTFEERAALIERMVAARPDRANPFTSPIQRRHRAKLILQSLGRDFGDAEPWIDLSQYPQNWPELARRQAAA
jgi:hypothetical protein